MLRGADRYAAFPDTLPATQFAHPAKTTPGGAFVYTWGFSLYASRVMQWRVLRDIPLGLYGSPVDDIANGQKTPNPLEIR